MIPPPPCFTVGWTQSSIKSFPAILLTYTLPLLLCKRNLDSSLKMACEDCSAVQSLWVRAYSRPAFLCRDVRRGFFLGLRPMCPASLSLLRVLEIDTLTPLPLSLGQSYSDQTCFFRPWFCLLSSLSFSFVLESWGLSHFLSVSFFSKYRIHFFGYSLRGQQSPVVNSLPQTMPAPFHYLQGWSLGFGPMIFPPWFENLVPSTSKSNLP